MSPFSFWSSVIRRIASATDARRSGFGAGTATAATMSARGLGRKTERGVFVLIGLFVFLAWGATSAKAYSNEVYESGGTYRWKINNVEAGSSPSLATAINSCIWGSTGAGREIHVLVGGSLDATLGIPGDVKVFGHGNSFTTTHTGIAVHARNVSNIQIRDILLNAASNFYVFRITGCSNVVLTGIHINGGGIGMRLDSHASRPLEFWSYNLTVTDCTFENLGSHGIETFGYDGIYVDRIVARNNGECGVLFNGSSNGYVGTIDAYRCSYGGGYAGLRFANRNKNFRVKYLKSVECGRGFFTTTDAKNIVVEEVYIRGCSSHAILIQYSDEVGINSGTHDGFVINHYTSQNCWILATDATGVTVAPPAAPAAPLATVVGGGVSLSWPAVTGATNYLVQRATSSGGRFETIAYRDSTTFVDRNVETGVSYYYVVRATNAAGPGLASLESSAGPVAPVVDTDLGLQLHYPFDGSGANSRGGAPALISGAPNYVNGMLNVALAFDGGTNFATLPVLPSGDYRDFTVATWVWPGAGTDWQRVFDFGSGTGNYMFVARVGGVLRFDLCRSGSVQTMQIDAPPLDRWVHVAISFIGNRATLYTDGVVRKSVMFNNGPAQLALTQNYIGKSQFASDPLFMGRIDDFRLYDRGLTAAEVLKIVNDAPPLAPFALMAGGFGSRATLNWEGVISAATYNVKRSTTSGGPYTTIASGLSSTNYVDTLIVAGATYYYVVTGSNQNGESTPSNEAVAVASDLSLHLRFNEGSGTVAADSSGNGWNASLVNTATFGAGILGNSLQLIDTAGQHATLPKGVVSGLDDFTISAWVKVTAFSTFARVFDFGSGTNSYMMLTPQYTTGVDGAKMRFAITNSGAGGEQQISSSVAVPVDTWAHVAVTLSGTTGRLYLNGALVGTNANITVKPSQLGYTTQNYLGRSQFADPFYAGLIDDFRIHARALSAGEVTGLLAGAPAVAPGSLTATPSGSSILLAWAASGNAASYTVKRSTMSGGPYATIASGVVALSYTDSSVVSDTTYYYVVSATNAQGESPNSIQGSATLSDLFAWLKFDEKSGTTAADVVGGGWSGTLVNGPTWIPGYVKNAVNLANTSGQHIVLPAGVTSTLNDFTIATWVRVSAFGNWARLFDFGSGTNNYMFLAPQYDGSGANAGKMRFAIRTPSVGEQTVTSSTAIPLNTWVHVAVTLNGTTARLYLDGAEVGANAAMSLKPSSLGNTTQNYLGRSQFNDPYFNGSLDDFRVYNRALAGGDLFALSHPAAQPPDTVTAVPGIGQVALAWSGAGAAVSYTVKRSTSPGGPFTTIAGGITDLGYTDTGLVNGANYYYVVSANNAQGESADSVPLLVTPSHLRLRLKFDETGGSVAVDSSGRGQTAALSNAPLFGAGRLNNALTLASSVSQHATLPAGIVDGLTTVTIAGWIKTDTVATWQRIFDFGTGTTNYMFLTTQSGTGGNANKLYFGIRTPAVAEQSILSSVAIPVGTWAHFAVVLNGSTGRLYVNGTQVGQNTAMSLSPASLGSTTQNYLGRSQWPDPYLNASLDEFLIYATALSSAEIAQLASPPAAPFGFEASSGNQQVILSWNAVADATGYTLRRSIASGGPYAPVALNVSGTSFTDRGLNNGTTYHYILTALKGVAEGAYSAEASAMARVVAPASPGGLSAIAGDGQVSISWNASAGASSYAVYRRLATETEYDLLAAGLAGTVYVDGAVTNGLVYSYVVTASNSAGASEQSTPVSASPLAPPSALESWRATHFGSAANEGPGADDADFDLDGLPNLVEYALGSDPTQAGAASYRVEVSGGVLRLVFNRIADPSLVYTVQASSDLGSWTGIWSSTGAANTAGPVAVDDLDTAASFGRRFLRLQVGVVSASE